jgi:large subunit ribosomal protein L9
VKILFLEDVLPTARAGDIKDVKTGFARNYLIPNKLAAVATAHELRRSKKLREAAEQRRLREVAEWKDVVDNIEGVDIEIKVRTGTTGRLYGSVTNTMIASELNNLIGKEVDRKSIKIPSPIRTIGKYKIPANLADGVTAELSLSVLPDDQSEIINKELEKLTPDKEIVDSSEEDQDPTFEQVLSSSEPINETLSKNLEPKQNTETASTEKDEEKTTN